MDEAEQLTRDRRLYHLHAATFIVGLFGLIGAAALSAMTVPRVAIWIAVGFAAILSISGVLAIIVKRTLFSKRAEDTQGFDFEGYPGDAIETPGLWSGDYAPYANAVAPYTVLLVGLVFLALLLTWALR
jgi:hypothetical protein